MGAIAFTTHQSPEAPARFAQLTYDFMKPSAPAGHGKGIDFPLSNRVKVWMHNFGGDIPANTAGRNYKFDARLKFMHRDKGTMFELPICPTSFFGNAGASTVANPWPSGFGGKVTNNYYNGSAWATQDFIYGWSIFEQSKDVWNAANTTLLTDYIENKMLFFSRIGSSDIGTPTGVVYAAIPALIFEIPCNRLELDIKPWNPDDFSGLTTTHWAWGAILALPEFV